MPLIRLRIAVDAHSDAHSRLIRPEKGIHARDGVALKVREHVRVAVHRHTDLRMTEHLLNDFRIDALTQHHRCGPMPEIMKSSVPQLGLSENALESSNDCPRLQRCSLPAGEHQALDVAPFLARSEPQFELPRPMSLQSIDGACGQPHDARLPGLGLDDL